MIPKELRQIVNKTAHAEALRYEVIEKVRLMAELEKMMESGASFNQLHEWLDGATTTSCNDRCQNNTGKDRC